MKLLEVSTSLKIPQQITMPEMGNKISTKPPISYLKRLTAYKYTQLVTTKDIITSWYKWVMQMKLSGL
jgi:hypothetical protein